MKVCFRNLNQLFSESEVEVIKRFILFLQKETPLNKDVSITFLDRKKGKMTTGNRLHGHRINVLAHGRLLIDVLRTLSHEWVHEFQHQKLGLKEKKKYQDIGGPVENMANVLSGIFMKKFQKEYPSDKKILYAE